MQRIKLFCIPYAGGTAMIFNRWKPFLNGEVELTPIELPGRGARFSEPMCSSFDEMVEDVYQSVIHKAGTQKYAIFGHSMGSEIAYELYHILKARGERLPVHMFFSGRNPPHYYERVIPTYTLKDEEFEERLLRMGGTAKEVFENMELKKLFMPIIRNDLRILEEKPFIKDRDAIKCSITIFYGKQDAYIDGTIAEWDRYTAEQCNFCGYEGNHFFIFDKQEEVIDEIKKALKYY